MGKFETALKIYLKDKKKLVENPADLEEVSNYGISLRYLKSFNRDATENDIKALKSIAKVSPIYKEHIWDKFNLEIYPEKVAIVLFYLYKNFTQSDIIEIIEEAANLDPIGLVDQMVLDNLNELDDLQTANNILNLMIIKYKNFAILHKDTPHIDKQLEYWLNNIENIRKQL